MKKRSTLFSLRRLGTLLTIGALLSSCTALDSGGGNAISGKTIGEGPVRVAVILPLSGSASAIGQDMLKAAELAHKNITKAGVTLLIKDDGSTPDRARAAAQSALSEKAELIIGPLTSAQTRAVAEVASAAQKPVISFSTDTSVASPGVYLIGFLPQTETDQIISFAAAQGKKSIAALIPQNAYGDVAETALLESAARKGMRVQTVERYSNGQAYNAAKKILPLVTGENPVVDVLFIPDSGSSLSTINSALHSAQFNPSRVKILGTGVWSGAGILNFPSFQGAWYASPDGSGYRSYANAFRTQFGSEPIRLSSQTYDAVSLAIALTRTQGSQRFTESVLTSPSGFSGVDGVFRFLPNGQNNRSYSIFEIQNGSAKEIRKAPKSFAK